MEKSDKNKFISLISIIGSIILAYLEMTYIVNADKNDKIIYFVFFAIFIYINFLVLNNILLPKLFEEKDNSDKFPK